MLFETIMVGPLGVNCFIVGCERTGEGLVVDPGGDAENILNAVRRLGLTVRQVLNTHGHFDHVGGNRPVLEALGARLLIHEADVPMLTRVTEVAQLYGMTGENSPQPDAVLTDGMEIVCGDCHLTVLHTPGHTQGGCCFYLEAERIVITGDTLFADSIGRTDLPGGNHQQLLESIRSKLFTLPDEVTAWPGHGPETTIGHEKRHNPYF